MKRGKNKKRCLYCNHLFDKKDISVHGICSDCRKLFARTDKRSSKHYKRIG